MLISLHINYNLTKVLFLSLSYFINVSFIHLYGWNLYKRPIETGIKYEKNKLGRRGRTKNFTNL